MTYDPASIEPEWQDVWRVAGAFDVPSTAVASGAYIFAGMPADPTQICLTDVRRNVIADVQARFRRARGEEVLYGPGLHKGLDWLGFSFDNSRPLTASVPEVHLLTQTLFIALAEAGAIIDHGSGPQRWGLDLSCYAEENDLLLDQMPWSEAAIASERALLGRVDGVEFEVQAISGASLTVFTPFSDAIPEAAFVALSPHHPDVFEWITADEKLRQLEAMLEKSINLGRSQVIDSGSLVQIPIVEQPVPVLITPWVDVHFGHTAVLGIPSTSAIDAEISAPPSTPSTVTWHVKPKPLSTRPAKRYRVREAAVSDDSYGTGPPVPIVDCDTCGTVLTSTADITMSDTQGIGKQNRGPGRDCPLCGHPCAGPNEVISGPVASFAGLLALALPVKARSEQLKQLAPMPWLPAAFTVRPAGDALTLGERTIAKTLRDHEVLSQLSGEPHKVALVHGTVYSHETDPFDEVTPAKLAVSAGADALRFALLYAAAPQKDFTWNQDILRHVKRFLQELWEFSSPRLATIGAANDIDLATRPRRRLLRWCQIATARVSENLEAMDMHRATRNTMTLFERIVDFERLSTVTEGGLASVDREATAIALRLLLQLLNPLVPHLTEELWRRSESKELAAQTYWPTKGQQTPENNLPNITGCPDRLSC